MVDLHQLVSACFRLIDFKHNPSLNRKPELKLSTAVLKSIGNSEKWTEITLFFLEISWTQLRNIDHIEHYSWNTWFRFIDLPHWWGFVKFSGFNLNPNWNCFPLSIRKVGIPTSRPFKIDDAAFDFCHTQPACLSCTGWQAKFTLFKCSSLLCPIL